MRRLLLVATLLSLTACYTQIKQTRAPVSPDCGAWPVPAAEGDRLVLRAGQVGSYGDIRILFADLELNAGRMYRPHYRSWHPQPIWWVPSRGWCGTTTGAALVDYDWWYGPPAGRAYVDVVDLSVCTTEGVPVDRRLYLSHEPALTKNSARVGPYTIMVERLRLEPADAPEDSTGEDYWNSLRSQGLLTLVVTRD